MDDVTFDAGKSVYTDAMLIKLRSDEGWFLHRAVGLLLGRCLAILVVVLFASACNVPPEDELEAAQTQIEAARKSEAGAYAPDAMRKAEDLLRDASAKVSERSYGEARALAQEARQKALEAEKAAVDNRAVLKEKSSAFVTDFDSRLEGLRARIEALPKKKAGTIGRLTQQLEELTAMAQTFKDSMAAGRLNDAQAMQPTLEAKASELADGLQEAESGG